MANLPAGIPRLDALVRAEAERLADEIDALLPVEQHHGPTMGEISAAFETLLRNLGRPESRDWAVRAGFDLDCNAHPEQGPFFDGLRDDWNNRRDDPTALAQALAAVCRNA